MAGPKLITEFDNLVALSTNQLVAVGDPTTGVLYATAVGHFLLGASGSIYGFQGSQGNQGWQGWQGFQGFQGNQGWQGVQGSFQGEQGWQGATGPAGGPQGFQGWQGFQGAQGTFSITASNGLTQSSGSIKLGGVLTQETEIIRNGNDFIISGTGFNDYSYFGTNNILLSLGDQDRHGFFSLSRLANGSSAQILIESGVTGSIGVETDSQTNSLLNEGHWYTMVYSPDFYSKIEADESGISIISGLTSLVAKGILISLTGSVKLNGLTSINTTSNIVGIDTDGTLVMTSKSSLGVTGSQGFQGIGGSTGSQGSVGQAGATGSGFLQTYLYTSGAGSSQSVISTLDGAGIGLVEVNIVGFADNDSYSDYISGKKMVRYYQQFGSGTFSLGPVYDIISTERSSGLTGSTWSIYSDGSTSIMVDVTGTATRYITWLIDYKFIEIRGVY